MYNGYTFKTNLKIVASVCSDVALFYCQMGALLLKLVLLSGWHWGEFDETPHTSPPQHLSQVTPLLKGVTCCFW